MTVKFEFASLDKPFERDWPVSIPVPLDGGGVEQQELNARFRWLSQEALDEINASTDPDAFFKSFFIGLPEIEDQAEFEALRAKMLARQYCRRGLQDAYVMFAAGVPVKNSKTSDGAGPPDGGT